MNKKKPKNKYREGMPDMPKAISELPVMRGYPVPWFVAEINGEFDFRVVEPLKFIRAITENRCWICGQNMGSQFTFVIGPMCLVNRITSEPASHYECAIFAAKACPFMLQVQTKYNDHKMPEEAKDPAGIMIKRQPGASVLYVTDGYRVENVGNGPLIMLSRPLKIEWWTKGRHSTLEEARESIETGIPILAGLLEKDIDEAKTSREKNFLKAMFDRKVEIAMNLLPGMKMRKPMLGSAAKRFTEIGETK